MILLSNNSKSEVEDIYPKNPNDLLNIDEDTNLVFTFVEDSPNFPGGDTARINFIANNLVYPEFARKNKIEGVVHVKFIVEKDGSLTNIKVIRGIGYGCDEEALRIVRMMPKWNPGKQRTEPQRVYFSLPIKFSLKEYRKTNIESENPKRSSEEVLILKSDSTTNVFTFVETQPEFPGGNEELMKFLVQNLKYPSLAKENNIQGIVYVSFIVERDGSISNVRVLRGIGGGCDEEAARVIKLMPKWKPGVQKGKTVRTNFSIPIKFTLSSENKSKETEKKGKKSSKKRGGND